MQVTGSRLQTYSLHLGLAALVGVGVIWHFAANRQPEVIPISASTQSPVGEIPPICKDRAVTVQYGWQQECFSHMFRVWESQETGAQK